MREEIHDLPSGAAMHVMTRHIFKGIGIVLLLAGARAQAEAQAPFTATSFKAR